jgi:hypothetical protein
MWEALLACLSDTTVASLLPAAAAAAAAVSTTIVEYLASAYPDSGTALMPPDAYTAARVKLFSRYFAVRRCAARLNSVVTAHLHSCGGLQQRC